MGKYCLCVCAEKIVEKKREKNANLVKSMDGPLTAHQYRPNCLHHIVGWWFRLLEADRGRGVYLKRQAADVFTVYWGISASPTADPSQRCTPLSTLAK
jgi:hypothetical protein